MHSEKPPKGPVQELGECTTCSGISGITENSPINDHLHPKQANKTTAAI